MHEAKNTARALVRIGFDGSVHKFFRATDANERFENELRVLLYLERRQCPFVPRVLSYDRDTLELVTSNCGARVEQLSDGKQKEIFAELEQYGVRHDDPFLRNITYRNSDGRFCVIDFEFATILEPDEISEGGLEAPVTADSVSGSATETPHPPILSWSGATDRGRFRPNNEDAFLSIAFDAHDLYYLGAEGEVPSEGMDFVFAVSDGMGGERSGEFASRFTMDNITRLLPRRFSLAPRERHDGIRECLLDLFQGIHRQLTTLGNSYEEGRNMGATLSLIWVARGWIYVGHIGDSRVYHLPKSGGMTQLTHDHTYVGWLHRQGKLNEREVRFHPRKNVLNQALGAGNQRIDPQLVQMRCEVGDQFLLCTDGVVEGLWNRALEELVREPPAKLRFLTDAQRLVQTASAESGRDNASAMVVSIK